MRPPARFTGLLVLLLAGAAWAEPTLVSDEKTQDYAHPKTWDMVFVAEGYLESEEAEFLERARALSRKLRMGSTAKAMRETYTFNLHYVFVASETHVSWRPGGEPGKTVCRSFVDRDGVLVTDDALADVVALEAAPDVDSIVILANFDDPSAHDPSTFGALESVVSHPDHVRANADMPSDGKRVRQPSLDPDSFIHELGHALFGLGDEYGEYEGDFPEAESSWEIALTPNLSTDPSGTRWRHIVDTVFEGGGYYSTGVYRPEKSCRMRESRSKKFCRVCEATIRGVVQVSAPSDVAWTAPAEGATVVPSSLFSAKTAVTWSTPATPLYFAVELYRAKDAQYDDASPVWDTYVEGHQRKLSLPLPIAQPGRYELRIFAINYREESTEGAARQFELRQLKSAQAGSTPGFTGAVPGN